MGISRYAPFCYVFSTQSKAYLKESLNFQVCVLQWNTILVEANNFHVNSAFIKHILTLLQINNVLTEKDMLSFAQLSFHPNYTVTLNLVTFNKKGHFTHGYL